MAHKKAGSTAKTNRDSISKRLGVKKYGGQVVAAGNIIVRQKGNRFYAGRGAKTGKDFTIYAITSGLVFFKRKLGKTVIDILNKVS